SPTIATHPPSLHDALPISTAHAVEWNHKPIRFMDCAPDTWLVRPEDVPEGVSLIMATHVSGVPCDVEGLERRAREIGARLIFDRSEGHTSELQSREKLVCR